MSKDGPIFHKFNVTRTDGSSEPGGKHRDCDYFVLDTTHDKHAKYALAAYADACEETHPNLAANIRQTYVGFPSFKPEAITASGLVDGFDDATCVRAIEARNEYLNTHVGHGLAIPAMRAALEAAIGREVGG